MKHHKVTKHVTKHRTLATQEPSPDELKSAGLNGAINAPSLTSLVVDGWRNDEGYRLVFPSVHWHWQSTERKDMQPVHYSKHQSFSSGMGGGKNPRENELTPVYLEKRLLNRNSSRVFAAVCIRSSIRSSAENHKWWWDEKYLTCAKNWRVTNLVYCMEPEQKTQSMS